jgi:hypothetical protein
MARSKKNQKPFIIDDNTDNDILYPKDHDRGLDIVARDNEAGLIPMATISEDGTKIILPNRVGADPQEIRIYDESEWDALYDDQQKYETSMKHIRMRGNKGKMIPSTDQNGWPYCWSFSSGSAYLLARAIANLPYVELAPQGPACIIKGFKQEGGWTGQAAPFYEERGCPSTKVWPKDSVSRANDNPATWADAANYKPTETWIDMRASMYDRNLSRRVIATLSFNNIPWTMDNNDWAHSIGGLNWVRQERGLWLPEIWNSWNDGWGNNGMALLNGRRAEIAGACAFRTPLAQAA